MFLRQISDDALAQYAYLIGCQRTGEALLVDPERDVWRYLKLAEEEGLRITGVAETHLHADFVSGARELAALDPDVTLYLSDEGGDEWRSSWARSAGYRVRFLKDGAVFHVGNIEVRAVHTPGHTPEHLSYLITDIGGGADEPMGMLTGDFVFVGNLGRPDLLESAAGIEGMKEPSARRLHASALAFLDLPDHLQIWPAHGSGTACGKGLGAIPQSTVGYERRFNPAIAAARKSEEEFVRYILAGQSEPPLYFARMKQLNRDGAPVLGEMPSPVELGAVELARLSGWLEVTVLDTRSDRDAFLSGHLAASIHAPLDRSFPTMAGSYADPHRPLYLIVERERVGEAVTSLIRIGLDQVVGYATPETLKDVQELVATESIGFDELERRRERNDVRVVDVRTASEFESGHVPGAVNVAHTRLIPRLHEIPRDGLLLVHCVTGARAGSAVSFLEREGFRVVHVGGALRDRGYALGTAAR